MNGMARWLATGALLLGLVNLSAFAGEEANKPATEAMGNGCTATMSPLAKAPVLDGKIEDGEYGHAVGTINFLSTFGNNKPGPSGANMDLREGRTWCGYYDGRLYIAIISDLPPRALGKNGQQSNAMDRDAELVFDPNSIEIWIDPNRDRRESQQGDQAFYQFFVNAVGSLYDARLEPGKGVDKGFNCDIKTANSVDNDKKLWTTEISIPLKDLGWETGTEIGRSIGVLICRNFKAPWTQPTWFPHGGGFVEWYKYPRIYITKDEPNCAIDSLGEGLWNAQPDFKIRISNPGPARTAKVKFHVKSTDMPDLLDEKEVALPANGEAFYSFKPGNGALHNTADHYFKVRIESTDAAKAYFDYYACWTRDPITAKGWSQVRWSTLYPLDQKWAVRAVAAPDNALDIAVYPTYKRFKINTDISMLVGDPEGKDKASLSDKADIVITRDGAEVAKTTFSYDVANNKYAQSHTFDLPDIPEGTYVVTATFNKHPMPIVKEYKRIKFEFEGNTRGITDTIYPPFEPVKATDGNVSVVCREYGVGDLGLWKSIKSLGKEMLAGPIVIKADDSRVLTGAAKLAESKPMQAVYTASAADDAVSVDTVCTTEIDGCMKVELTLKPGSKKAELKHLALEIPLKDSMIPLHHFCTTALRVNPVGELPAGEGVIWDSRKFPNGDWLGNFTPYMWLGNVERGLAVFANNDKGWVLNWNEKREFSPCQEIIRKDGVLTLRLNLVQKPTTISEPRKIVLGFMASPTKPMRKDWRSILGWGGDLGQGFEKLLPMNFAMPWATGEVFCGAYPWKKDYSLYDGCMQLEGTPGGDFVKKNGFEAFKKDWLARNSLDKPDDQLNDFEKRVKGVGVGPVDPHYRGLNVKYWDEYHGDSMSHPERKVFGGEFNGNNMCQSRRDFRVYHAYEFAKRGIGLYFDNTFPHASRDLVTSDAYELAPFGIQPSANLWEQRDYHRRIWNVQKQLYAEGKTLGQEVIQQIHHTNGFLITFSTWVDSTCDLEWFYGPEPQQSKYLHGMLRAESAAQQAGCIPFVLARIMYLKSTVEEHIANRTQFGTMMVHEIKLETTRTNNPQGQMARILYGAGYADPDAQVFSYWGDVNPVAVSNQDVKTLLVKKGSELMLLAVTWNKNPETVKITLDTKKLGMTPEAAVDAEGTLEDRIAANTIGLEAAKKNVADAQATMEKLKADAADMEKQSAAAEAETADAKDAKAVKALEQKRNTAKAKRLQNELAQKKATANLGRAESELKKIEELIPLWESFAKLPLSYDAKKAELTLDMSGYGVRMIKLK